MAERHVNIPDSAKEVHGRSSSDQLEKLYRLYDKAVAEGKDVYTIDGSQLGNYPHYICTHYIVGVFSTICLIERKKGK